MDYDRQASWQNPRVLGLLFLVFLVGAAAGAVVMSYKGQHTVTPPPPRTLDGLTNDRYKGMTLQHFKKELNLTPAQTQQIGGILDDFLKYMQMLQDQVDDTRATGKERILKVLNDEQKQKFRSMMDGFQKPAK